MKNRGMLAKQKGLEVALNVIIIFMVLILLIMTLITATNFKDTIMFHYDTDDFAYDMGYKEYGGMVYKYYQNKAMNYQGNQELQEYYGVAKFYEAATLYKAYMTMGDTENSTFFQEKMKGAEAEMGDWIVLKEEILKELELN